MGPAVPRRLAAATLAVAAALAAFPQRTIAQYPTDRFTAQRASTTGTITALDLGKRLMSVESPAGTFTYRLDAKVSNADQLKVGDRVQVDFVAALAVKIRRGGEDMRQKMEKEAAARNAPAATPGSSYNRPVTIATEVMAVDRKAGTVRLKGPEGRISDFAVDKANLAGVKEGDKVVATVHEAVAVGVTPAAK
jgi:Cu/Ag efflux protein CusF